MMVLTTIMRCSNFIDTELVALSHERRPIPHTINLLPTVRCKIEWRLHCYCLLVPISHHFTLKALYTTEVNPYRAYALPRRKVLLESFVTSKLIRSIVKSTVITLDNSISPPVPFDIFSF